ncbi:spore coat protein YsxE [Bacillus gobiensis]|uniref:spore coat protein YsxE n=1 Tax=Bacillus gobiensis TaxID=1441095 RepID=UPI003D235BDF
MDEIRSILNEYGLQLEYAESVSDKVYKVYTNHGAFALKQLSANRNSRFTDQMIQLEKLGYRSFVPVYRTHSGQFLAGQDSFYYLMPWLHNDKKEERDQKHVHLFKETALMHKRTMKEIKINRTDVEKHYEDTKKKWEEQKLVYEKFVDRAEREWYLSPFELQAVTYFSETIQATDFASERLEKWYEAIKEKETTRLALTHGQISVHHFLYNDVGNGYFTNFEKAEFAPPINDLLLFYTRTFKTYPKTCSECADWYYTYHRNSPLLDEEVNLLLSYMAYPHYLFKVINRYQSEQNQNEKMECTELIKSYWQMKNTEPFVTQIHENEENRKRQEESSSS